MSVQYHHQANQINKTLDGCGINTLYHFTAIDNLSTIRECGGLWSKEKLESDGRLDDIITGGNKLSLKLDRYHGNWNKVHLYFCPNTPMSYRIQENPEERNPQSANICYLLIDPNVASWQGVYFTDTNATENEHQRAQGLDGANLVDFSTIRKHLRKIMVPKQIWKRSVQAECLVPNEIPLKFVKSMGFISQASMHEGERLWGQHEHPPFIVSNQLFHKGFPYVEKFYLTSQTITKEDISKTQFMDKRFFSQGSDSRVTFLVDLYASAGCQARVCWHKDDILIEKEELEFDRQSRYWHWANLEVPDLKPGDYYVEYYLRDIRYCRVDFGIGR